MSDGEAKTELQKFLDEINSDFFVQFHNEHAPETIFSLEQRTHHHVFAEKEAAYPEEGVVECVCSCGVKIYFVEEYESVGD